MLSTDPALGLADTDLGWSGYPEGMKLKLRAALLAPLVISAMALGGCAGNAPIAGNPSPAPGEPGTEVAATWLDGGRMIALVTWGSSSCVPQASEVTASGQEVSVTLADGANQACTADYAPRASAVGVPAGVDPHEPVTVNLTYLGQTVGLTLAGDPELTGTPGQETDYQPTAGWFNDQGIALLTWGSSSCRPVVEGVEETADAVTVTFATQDGVCTADMAPRVTLLQMEQVDRSRQLILVGDNLDATIPISG